MHRAQLPHASALHTGSITASMRQRASHTRIVGRLVSNWNRRLAVRCLDYGCSGDRIPHLTGTSVVVGVSQRAQERIDVTHGVIVIQWVIIVEPCTPNCILEARCCQHLPTWTTTRPLTCTAVRTVLPRATA